jgi:hypothetical protein
MTASLPTLLDTTMGTKHQRFTIDRAFMRAIRATGAYQEFADTQMRGFRVKVTPAGLASYTYRGTRPDGSMGRVTLGRWPQMNPGEARNRSSRPQGRHDDDYDSTPGEAHAAKKTGWRSTDAATLPRR